MRHFPRLSIFASPRTCAAIVLLAGIALVTAPPLARAQYQYYGGASSVTGGGTTSGGGYATQARPATQAGQATQATQGTGYVSPYSNSTPTYTQVPVNTWQGTVLPSAPAVSMRESVPVMATPISTTSAYTTGVTGTAPARAVTTGLTGTGTNIGTAYTSTGGTRAILSSGDAATYGGTRAALTSGGTATYGGTRTDLTSGGTGTGGSRVALVTGGTGTSTTGGTRVATTTGGTGTSVSSRPATVIPYQVTLPPGTTVVARDYTPATTTGGDTPGTTTGDDTPATTTGDDTPATTTGDDTSTVATSSPPKIAKGHKYYAAAHYLQQQKEHERQLRHEAAQAYQAQSQQAAMAMVQGSDSVQSVYDPSRVATGQHVQQQAHIQSMAQRLGALKQQQDDSRVASVDSGESWDAAMAAVAKAQQAALQAALQQKKWKRDGWAKQQLYQDAITEAERREREKLAADQAEHERQEREKELRKNSKARRKNAKEQDDIKNAQDAQDAEQADLDARRQAAEQENRDREALDKDLREAEQEARRGPPSDPNCRGAACQQARKSKADNRQAMRDNASDLRAMEGEQRGLKNSQRALDQRNDRLQARLDGPKSVSGLEPDERKLRAVKQQKAARQARLAEIDAELDRYADKPNVSASEDRRRTQLRNEQEALKGEMGQLDEMETSIQSDMGGGGFDEYAGMPTDQLGVKTGESIARRQGNLNKLDAARDGIGKGGAPITPHDTAGRDRYDSALGEYNDAVDDANGRLPGLQDEIGAQQEQSGRFNNELNNREAIRDLENKRNRTAQDEQRLRLLRGQADPDLADVSNSDLTYRRNSSTAKANELVEEHDGIVDRVRTTRVEVDDAEFGRLADDAIDFTNDYNSSYGDSIDEDGNVRPGEVQRQANAYERGMANAMGAQGEIDGLQAQKTKLGDRGLTGAQQARGEAVLDRRIDAAQGRQDQAVADLEGEGVYLESDEDGRLQVASVDNPLLAGFYDAKEKAHGAVVSGKADVATDADRRLVTAKADRPDADDDESLDDWIKGHGTTPRDSPLDDDDDDEEDTADDDLGDFGAAAGESMDDWVTRHVGSTPRTPSAPAGTTGTGANDDATDDGGLSDEEGDELEAAGRAAEAALDAYEPDTPVATSGGGRPSSTGGGNDTADDDDATDDDGLSDEEGDELEAAGRAAEAALDAYEPEAPAATSGGGRPSSTGGGNDTADDDATDDDGLSDEEGDELEAAGRAAEAALDAYDPDAPAATSGPDDAGDTTGAGGAGASGKPAKVDDADTPESPSRPAPSGPAVARTPDPEPEPEPEPKETPEERAARIAKDERRLRALNRRGGGLDFTEEWERRELEVEQDQRDVKDMRRELASARNALAIAEARGEDTGGLAADVKRKERKLGEKQEDITEARFAIDEYYKAYAKVTSEEEYEEWRKDHPGESGIPDDRIRRRAQELGVQDTGPGVSVVVPPPAPVSPPPAPARGAAASGPPAKPASSGDRGRVAAATPPPAPTSTPLPPGRGAAAPGPPAKLPQSASDADKRFARAAKEAQTAYDAPDDVAVSDELITTLKEKRDTLGRKTLTKAESFYLSSAEQAEKTAQLDAAAESDDADLDDFPELDMDELDEIMDAPKTGGRPAAVRDDTPVKTPQTPRRAQVARAPSRSGASLPAATRRVARTVPENLGALSPESFSAFVRAQAPIASDAPAGARPISPRDLSEQFGRTLAGAVMEVVGRSPVLEQMLPGVIAQIARSAGPDETSRLLFAAMESFEGLPRPDGLTFMNALFQQVTSEAYTAGGSEGYAVAQLAHAQFLQAVLTNLKLQARLGLGGGDVIAAEAVLDGLVKDLLQVYGQKLSALTGQLRRDPAVELDVLAVMANLRNMPVASAGDVGPVLKRIEDALKRAAAAGTLADPTAVARGALNLASTLDGLLQNYGPSTNVDQVRLTLANAANAFALLGKALDQAAQKATDADQRAALTVQADAARLRQARYLLAQGENGAALELLHGVPSSPQQIQALLGAINHVDSAWDRMTAVQRTTLSNVITGLWGGRRYRGRPGVTGRDILRDQRRQLLSMSLRNADDPQTAAMVALRLAAEWDAAGNSEHALNVLRRAFANEAKNDPMVAGEILRREITAAGPGVTAEDVQRLVDTLSPELRIPAIALAAGGLAQAGNAGAISALAGVLNGMGDAAPPQVRFHLTLARLEALMNQPASAATDAELKAAMQEARQRLDDLDGVDPEVREGLAGAFRQYTERFNQVNLWKTAVTTGTAPNGGWVQMARDALRAGRLDLAKDALSARLAEIRKSRTMGHDDRRTAFMEVVALLELVDRRADDPTLTDSQRGYARTLVTGVGKDLADTIQLFLDDLQTDRAAVAGMLQELREASTGLSRLGEAVSDAVSEAMDKPGAAIRTAKKPSLSASERRLKNAEDSLSDSYHDLRFLARLHARATALGVERGDAPNQDARTISVGRRRGELNAEVQAADTALKDKFDGMGDDVEDGATRQSLDVDLAGLNSARAIRDGVEDYYTNLAPGARAMARGARERDLNGFVAGSHAWGHSTSERKAATKRILEDSTRIEHAREQRLGAGLVSENANPNHWLRLILLEDEETYLENRVFDLIAEDPDRSRTQKEAQFDSFLETEGKFFDYLGPANELAELLGQGTAYRARAKSTFAQIEKQQWDRVDRNMNEAVQAGNFQAAYLELLRLRERAMAGEIDAYVRYVNFEWLKLGPVKTKRLLFDSDEASEAIISAIADAQVLDAALARAAYRDISELDKGDQGLLEAFGFIVVTNGTARYSMPEDFKIALTDAGTKFGKEHVVDKYINVQTAGELAATVVIPGALSARVAARTFGTMGWQLMMRGGSKHGAMWFSRWALSKLAYEAALFTTFSRISRIALDPQLLQSEQMWSLSALGEEYVHNLAILGALKVVGFGMGKAENALASRMAPVLQYRAPYWAWRSLSGSATIVAEAGALTGMSQLLGSNTLAQDDFIGNLLTVVLLKGMHIGQGTRDFRSDMARWNRARVFRRMQQKFSNDPAAVMLRERFKGSWDNARDLFNDGKVTKQDMQALFDLRKRVVDTLAQEIVNELGGDVKAFGSEKLSSDYDLSFYGPMAELAVVLFNGRIASAWGASVGVGGAESATRLDTNVYTNPVYELFKGEARDVFLQDGFAHMAGRKYMDAKQWAEHRQRVLDNMTDTAARERMRDIFDNIDASEQSFRDAITEQVRELTEEFGERWTAEEIQWAATNRLYEAKLREIIQLKHEYKAAERVGDKNLLRSERAGDTKRMAEITQKIRQLQGEALYYAAEAYQTEAAILHVVFTIQAAKRSITPDTLLADTPPELKIPLTEAQGRQSFFEQLANSYHVMNHGHLDAAGAGKVSKYILRALDAAQIAGIKLRSYEDLVRLTYEIEANRGDAAKVAEILKAKYGEKGTAADYARDVQDGLRQLTEALVKRQHLPVAAPKAPAAKPARRTGKLVPFPGAQRTQHARRAPMPVWAPLPKAA